MPEPAQKSAIMRPKRSPKPSDKASTTAPKRTQRERLVAAMIELSAQSGYGRTSVAQVSSHAGVSSATFYELFEDKEACLLAAYRTATQEILGQMQLMDGGGNWREVATVMFAELLPALQSNPDAGRVLMIEARAAGPLLRKERKREFEGFEERIEQGLRSTPSDADTLDIPSTAMVGAVRSIIVRRLRTHAEDELPSLAGDLLTWIGSYAAPSGSERWSTGRHALLPATTAQELPPAPAAPVRLPRGRHGLPAGVVARSQRTRIIYGTAEVMMAKGYANVTVADIVAAAGIARDVFYEHFSDKQHAFLEAQNFSTQDILDACAAAYFAAQDWPERVWSGLHALVAIIVSHRSLSHLRLVECYAAGPTAIRRAEEITRSFTIFLEEGYRYRPEARDLPRLCSQAITGAIFEVIYRRVARDEFATLGQQLPLLVYIAIAPFTGREEAIELVTQMTRRHATSGGA
jgi:AcrR family transcriptional regulator